MMGTANDAEADRPILVTGGDATYFPMIEELLASIRAAAPSPPPALGVVDAGLTPEQAESLRAAGVLVVRPPLQPFFPAAALRARPALAANLAKPWLDRLFPGHAVIVWLDGDTWVQDYAAVALLVGAARTGALAITSDANRSWERPIAVRWLLGGLWGLAQVRSFNFKNGRHAGLPLSVLKDLATRPLLHAGAYALRADAPHWEAMRRWQAKILRRGKPFTSDQLAMALAVHTDGLDLQLLPETCNYIHPWLFDPAQGVLVEAWYPHAKVGIVHLAGQKRMRFDPEATIEVMGLDRRLYTLSLRYGTFRRMAAAIAA